jgi:putative heme iron utilization protein
MQENVGNSSLAVHAKRLVWLGDVGNLSTQSRRFDGFPFGSLMPYVADRLGRPVFFISSLAVHALNLQADWRASLLITAAAADPWQAERVTLIGRVEQIADAGVRELYFERHTRAREWQDFSDFSFYRMYPAGIYFVGGFGVMGWVSTDEYAAAIPPETAGGEGGIRTPGRL